MADKSARLPIDPAATLPWAPRLAVDIRYAGPYPSVQPFPLALLDADDIDTMFSGLPEMDSPFQRQYAALDEADADAFCRCLAAALVDALPAGASVDDVTEDTMRQALVAGAERFARETGS